MKAKGKLVALLLAGYLMSSGPAALPVAVNQSPASLAPPAMAPVLTDSLQAELSLPVAPEAQGSVPFEARALEVGLVTVASGLDRPVFVTHAGDGTGRLFVVEKAGVIRVVSNGSVLPNPFLDIRDRVNATELEQGLLGLAFHPNFGSNGRFFVAYTALNGDNVLAEYRAGNEPDRADAASGRILLHIPHQFTSYHNTDMLAFGPDGYLYAGTGDGGGAGDPQGNSQNLRSLQGKLLRLDVDRGAPYSIPPDNPFVGQDGARPEIWAYGLRNPWRFSFDRATGDLWLSDVGQNTRDEINWQPGGDRGGQNYGWNIAEGTSCFLPAIGCILNGLAGPILDYGRDLGCAVIGGYVYRGQMFPQMNAAYFFGDLCSRSIWALFREQRGNWQSREMLTGSALMSSFGEDEAGELYLTDLNSGAVYQLTDSAAEE